MNHTNVIRIELPTGGIMIIDRRKISFYKTKHRKSKSHITMYMDNGETITCVFESFRHLSNTEHHNGVDDILWSIATADETITLKPVELLGLGVS